MSWAPGLLIFAALPLLPLPVVLSIKESQKTVPVGEQREGDVMAAFPPQNGGSPSAGCSGWLPSPG